MSERSAHVVHERDRTLDRPSAAIRELATLVLPIRDRLLLLPLTGVIDTHRVAVIDVTGVASIDTKVANIEEALALLAAKCRRHGE